MNNSSIGHYPSKDKWQFDKSVTDVFDDMLERSIPQYSTMRNSVTEIAKHFIQPNYDILDIGSSKGGAIAELVSAYNERNRFLGVEVSKPMIEASRERFKAFKNVEIINLDLRKDFPSVTTCVTMSIFTLQFVPIEYRQQLIQKIYDNMIPGGAFILVEKILGDSADLDNLLVDLYYKTKNSNGYSHEEIQRKKLSLEGVLVPVTAKWNEEMLRNAGFKRIDCFWRFLNFAGWVAIKER